MKETRNAYKILVGKSEQKTPLGVLVADRMIILKNSRTGIGFSGTNWIRLAQVRIQ
jgi:hypothetical protein